MNGRTEALDVLVCYIPRAHTREVLEALFAAGAGAVGQYRDCAYLTAGRGQFRPLPGADPAIGSVGDLTEVEEDRAEITFPRPLRREVVAALRRAHPYEEPAFHVLRNVAEEPVAEEPAEPTG